MYKKKAVGKLCHEKYRQKVEIKKIIKKYPYDQSSRQVLYLFENKYN